MALWITPDEFREDEVSAVDTSAIETTKLVNALNGGKLDVKGKVTSQALAAFESETNAEADIVLRFQQAHLLFSKIYLLVSQTGKYRDGGQQKKNTDTDAGSVVEYETASETRQRIQMYESLAEKHLSPYLTAAEVIENAPRRSTSVPICVEWF